MRSSELKLRNCSASFAAMAPPLLRHRPPLVVLLACLSLLARPTRSLVSRRLQPARLHRLHHRRKQQQQQQQQQGLAVMAAVAAEEVMIVMNGLPGAMGKEVAAACLRRGFQLAPVALTGADFGGTSVEVVAEPLDPATTKYGPPVAVSLVDGTDAAAKEAAAADIKKAAEAAGCAGNVVCIDYTHPSAVNGNAEWYAANDFAFVMGTTGGDRAALEETVLGAGTFAVIAPNMAKQIVALQATLEGMAAKFPGAFEGYSLTVRESHQSTKADTSGTAKAVVRALNDLNLEFDPNDGDGLEDRISRIRDEPGQLDFGVPADSLRGHAFHTYSLVSADGSVSFELQHNVCGRRVYAEGTTDAVLFIANKRAEQGGKKQTMFNMIDVLEAGAMA